MTPTDDPLRPTSKPRPKLVAKRGDDESAEASTPEAKVLALMKERFAYATSEWREVRAESLKDRRCLTPDGPWDDKDRRERIDAGRPCLTLDEISQYANQLINDISQNKRAIKVTPVGSGATDKSAEFRANLIRQIEYRSNAQQIYGTTFENCVNGSYGFGRILTRYVSEKSHDQELLIDGFPNPDMALPDPDFLKPDLSDCKYWFVTEPWRHSEFRAKFPQAKIQNFDVDLISRNAGWLTTDTVLVGEYWTIEHESRTLYSLKDGTQFLQQEGDPTPEDRLIVRKGNGELAKRKVEAAKVKKYITNGLEILETIEWPGKYIPLFGCLGKILYVGPDGQAKRQIQSLIRMARDPYMLWCYYKSTEAELVGMTPKTPYVGYVGQFRTRAADWQTVNHAPKPYVEADAMTEATGGTILPLPQRQSYDPAIQPLEIGGESARRSIQAAIGSSPLPTSAQRRNDKSGVALKQIEASAAKGSFHFVDHLDQMIARVGVLLDDLLDHFYDNQREVTTRTATDAINQVTINNPNDPESPQTGQGYEHDVTLSVGPSQDSERTAASDFADTLTTVSPQVFGLLGPLIVKLKNLGPIGDEIAELLQFMQPPEVRAMEDAKKNGGQAPALPPQVQQILEQQKQQIAQLTQALETEQVKQAAQVQIAQSKAQSDAQRTQVDADAKIEVARIKAASDQIIAEMKERGAELDQKLKAIEIALLEHRDQLDRDDAHEDQHATRLMGDMRPPEVEE